MTPGQAKEEFGRVILPVIIGDLFRLPESQGEKWHLNWGNRKRFV